MARHSRRRRDCPGFDRGGSRPSQWRRVRHRSEGRARRNAAGASQRLGEVHQARGQRDDCGGRMKILYVEDNDDNVFMLKSRLTRVGFAVVVASDGAAGVAMAVREKPDVILMDLSLPGLDGWEATRRIKAASETCHIPVIALSAH